MLNQLSPPHQKTYLVTGATSGLGLAAVRHMAKSSDVHVIAGVREFSRAGTLRRALPAARLTLLTLDVADLSSVRGFCAEVIQLGRPLHGLCLNAGLQFARGDLRSPDGFELTFATNHLGHFLMYELLAPQLTAHARVITIGSGTQNPNKTAAHRFGFRDGVYTTAAALAQAAPDPSLDAPQQGRDAYAASKTANLLFIKAMARLAPATTFLALEPGAMPGTGLVRDAAVFRRLMWHTLARLILPWMGGSTPERSGRVLAKMLVDPSFAAPSGSYLDVAGGEGHPHPVVSRLDVQDELILTSRRCVGC